MKDDLNLKKFVSWEALHTLGCTLLKESEPLTTEGKLKLVHILRANLLFSALA